MRYAQCLNCGRLTPVDKGVCYHCGAPLPSEVSLPLGTVVCPNCLRVTSVDTGYCRRCGAPLPPDLVDLALKEVRKYRLLRGELGRGEGRVPPATSSHAGLYAYLGRRVVEQALPAPRPVRRARRFMFVGALEGV